MAVQKLSAQVQVGDFLFTFPIERDYSGGAEWDVRVGDPTACFRLTDEGELVDVPWATLDAAFQKDVREACHDKAYEELYDYAERIRDEEEYGEW